LHLVQRFAAGGKRTIVLGHRGGFFGPENSLKGFKGAIENKVEGIEFDVSKTYIVVLTVSFSIIGLAKQGQCADGPPRWKQWPARTVRAGWRARLRLDSSRATDKDRPRGRREDAHLGGRD